MAKDLDSPPPGEQRPEEDVETLGSVLATARKKHGLTVKKMAADLRVESSLMEALEADRFDMLPAPVFTKGYLRHLAERFGLEYEDLLRRYTAEARAEDAPVTCGEPITEDNKLLVPLITWTLVIVVGIPAFWFTWVSRDSLSVSNAVSSDQEATTSQPAQVESVPEVAAPLPNPGVALEPAAPPPAVGLDAVQPTPAEGMPGDAPTPAEGMPGDAPTPAESVPGDAPPTAPPIRVALIYVQDSWTEVSDGNGDSLYYALGMAGTTASLDGVPPLSFVLGNPRGVQLSINDQPWPVPMPRDNATTVRFVVDEAP